MRVIAELGSNWKSFEDCKNAIALAKNIGADAIKFQLYTHEELYGTPGSIRGVMPRDWLPKLKIKADACGIELMCTAFSVQGIEYVDQFVSTHKLASSEMCHVEMLRTFKKIKKPLLVSTGGQSQKDIIAVNELLKPKTDVTFLYCEASYPSNRSDFRLIAELQDLTGRDVGLSDHTLEVFNVPLIAQQMGATVIEKHFNPFEYKDTPDAPHSLGVDDFKDMITSIHGFLPVLGPTRNEQDMILKHKRRLKAIAPIRPGDELKLNVNYGIFRSKLSDTDAMHPGLVDFLTKPLNKRIGVALNPGDAIKREDIL